MDIKVYNESGLRNCSESFLKRFIDEVRRSQAMAFDTEGDFKIRKSLEDSRGRLFVQIANYLGQVILFTDADDIPGEIKELFENPSIFKFQSNVKKDREHLGDDRMIRKIKVVNTSDVQVAYWSFLNPTTMTSSPFYIRKHFGALYESRWILPNCRFNTTKLDYDTLGYPPCDVRFPFLVYFKSAIQRAEKVGLKGTDNIFPYVRLAFHLTCGVEPANVKNTTTGWTTLETIDQNWLGLPRLDTETRQDIHRLNDLRTVGEVRQALSDIMDPPRRPLGYIEKVKTVLSRWGHQLPEMNRITRFGAAAYIEERCKNCGEDHGRRFKHCLANGEDCPYDHAGRDYPKHALLCCPELHQTCESCGQNGHRAAAHKVRDCVQLEQNFRAFQHRGLLTSLPFLALVDNRKKVVTNQIWRLGMWNQNLEDAPANAYLIGEYKPTFQDLSGAAAREREFKIESAKFNMDAYPDRQAAAGIDRHEFETLKKRWEEDCEREDEYRRKYPKMYAPVEDDPFFTGPKNRYVVNSKGKYVYNPGFRKGGKRTPGSAKKQTWKSPYDDDE